MVVHPPPAVVFCSYDTTSLPRTSSIRSETWISPSIYGDSLGRNFAAGGCSRVGIMKTCKMTISQYQKRDLKCYEDAIPRSASEH